MENTIVQGWDRQGVALPKVEVVPVKYCLYARKSTESEERQVLSIDSQIKEMLQLAEREKLEIVEIKKESHSAKETNQRPVFNEIIEEIRNGKYTGILTWAPDRISRNAGDLGKIIDLMDAGLLRDIRTYGQRFANSPNEKFLLMILGSQAKLENDNRGVNVKRGLRTKAEMGVRPGLAPLGYLNERSPEKGRCKIVIDPMRAPTIRKMFEHIAHSGMSGHAVYRWLTQVKLTTRSGKPLALSMVQRMLRNPFYYGSFEYPRNTGQWHKGSHEPLISRELFDEVQDRITTVPHAKWGAKEFDFVRLIKCAACNSSVSAQEHFKKRKSDGYIRRYVYYSCSRHYDRTCTAPYIREEELIQQLLSIIDSIDLNETDAKKKFDQEFAKHQDFMQRVLGKESDLSSPDRINVRNYVKHVLREGTREERRDVLSCLKSRMYLDKGQLVLKPKEIDLPSI
jgi:DNA invertase Pin-like site-specific DNA recombinase